MIGYKLTTKAFYSLYAQGKYKLRYLPGTTTTAGPATLGVMIFPRLSDALLFISKCTKRKQNITLLEVEYSACDYPYSVAANYTEASLDTYYDPDVYIPHSPDAFIGTVVCKSVKVIRQLAFPKENN